jgi:hypothetical protein
VTTKIGFTVALLYAAVGIALALFVFITEPNWRLSGVPFALVMFGVSWLSWKAVKFGYALPVALSPLAGC